MFWKPPLSCQNNACFQCTGSTDVYVCGKMIPVCASCIHTLLVCILGCSCALLKTEHSCIPYPWINAICQVFPSSPVAVYMAWLDEIVTAPKCRLQVIFWHTQQSLLVEDNGQSSWTKRHTFRDVLWQTIPVDQYWIQLSTNYFV